MKILERVLICCLAGVLLFSSCNDEFVPENTSRLNMNEIVYSNTILKKDFGMALAKILAESPYVRKLIKDEALKRIDNDYDVLYYLIKDRKVSGNTTFEDLLLQYINPEMLTAINTQIPNLTIFVPELPENSFSADLWDWEKEIPVVGIRTIETNDVYQYDSGGNESIIKACYIPGYPIVVVKENERIVAENSNSLSISNSSMKFCTKSDSKVVFRFLDNIFNNIDTNKENNLFFLSCNEYISTKSHIIRDGNRNEVTRGNSGPLYTTEQIQKVYDAYNIYVNTDGWQRDYIYYNISPSNSKGPFNNKFEEHLIGFEMVGDAKTAYNKIADQTEDPKFDAGINERSYRGGWTDGEFEFKIKIYLGSKNTTASELVKYMSIAPEQLFKLHSELQKSSGSSSYSYTVFKLEGVELKKANVLLPLFEWDLENYSSTVKISIEEVDSQETIRSVTSSTTDFATNFSFDVGFTEIVKLGMKFGVSTKKSHTTSYEVSTTKGNDELGEVMVNFGDQVISGTQTVSNVGNLRGGRVTPGGDSDNKPTVVPICNDKYNLGWCRIYIAPLKIN